MKKLNKKFILVLTLLISITVIFSACNSGGDNSSTDEDSYSGEIAQIEYWMFDTGGRSNNVLSAVVDNFNNSRQDIEVRIVYIAAEPYTSATPYDQRLNPAMAAGEAPDIIMVDGIVVDAVQRNLVADITDLIENDADFSLDIFYPHKVAQGILDGRHYALPYNTDYAGMLVYNRNMFRAAGLDPTKPPKTIAELDSLAEAMYITSDNLYTQMGFFPWTWLIGRPESLVRPFGGQWADEEGNATPTHPGNILAFEWLKTYVDKYGYEMVNRSAQSLGTAIGADFQKSVVAMDYVYNGHILDFVKQEIAFDWDLAPFPTLNGDESIDPGWGRGWQIGITTQSENKEAAFEFLKYYIGKEGMRQIVENFQETVTLSGIPEINEEFAKEMPRQMQVMINDIYPNIATENFVRIERVQYNELQQSAINRVLRGELEPRAALDEIATRYEGLIAGN